MAAISNQNRASDRKEGRRLRNLPSGEAAVPYFRRRRSESGTSTRETVDVTAVEQWLLDKRNEGWAGLDFSHVIIAAWVRTVSMKPSVNRFVLGRRFFARNDVSVTLPVERGGGRMFIRVSFSQNDTVFDVYRRMTGAMDEARASLLLYPVEKMSNFLAAAPRWISRLTVWGLRVLDWFDLLPAKLRDGSPYHASLRLDDLGSLGILPLQTALPDIGTLSGNLAYGARRRSGDARVVDISLNFDGRIASAEDFAGAVKCLHYFLRNPALLELPPDRIADDVL